MGEINFSADCNTQGETKNPYQADRPLANMTFTFAFTGHDLLLTSPLQQSYPDFQGGNQKRSYNGNSSVRYQEQLTRSELATLV